MNLDEKTRKQFQEMSELKKLPESIQATIYTETMRKWDGKNTDFNYWDLILTEYRLYKSMKKKYEDSIK